MAWTKNDRVCYCRQCSAAGVCDCDQFICKDCNNCFRHCSCHSKMQYNQFEHMTDEWIERQNEKTNPLVQWIKEENDAT